MGAERAVIIDALSGRQVQAGPEEVDATQPLIFYLTQRLGWHPGQLMTRPQWRVPKTPSGSRSGGYPVDIAIFDAPENVGDPDYVRILIECKAPTSDDGIGQLKTYLSLEPEAKLGIWFNGQRHSIVYKLADRFIVSSVGVIPRPTDPLSPTGSRVPITFETLVPPPEIGEVFRNLRDRIAAQDSRVNRDEFILNDMANLLICKISDEQQGELDPERHVAFQRSDTVDQTGHRIRAFFEEVRKRLPSVFIDDSDRLHIDDKSLHAVVETLESYRLLGSERHEIGSAFQVLRGRALKGQEGAYFTPPALVDCAIQIMAPSYKTRLIDPACGTGGFLAAALDYVFETVDRMPRLGSERKERAKRDWAQEQLHAVDKDVVSTKLCKAYLTLLGDGRAHVFRANSIDRSDWMARADELSRIVSFDKFDMIITNPPFGQNLTVGEETGRREGLLSSRKWIKRDLSWVAGEQYVEQQLGIAFYERCLDLLKEDGKMAIVLPETFLFSRSFKWFIDWVCKAVTVTHVIDIPMVAFEEFCRAKTCILFIQKRAPAPGHQITMSYPRSIGQDRRGRPAFRLDEYGVRAGELDNELADATRAIVGSEYRGEVKDAAPEGDSRLRFRVSQQEVRARGVLVPRFWWRADDEAALTSWCSRMASQIVTLGQLLDEGVLTVFEGHGSPPGNARATGDVPYVKVTDLKNWRINENPTNFVHHRVADKLKKGGVELAFGDLISPSRASSNIGQFCMVLPWQTSVLLTKEILGFRVNQNSYGLDSFLMLALMSLTVVQHQYRTLVLMQTNREHLGDHWREVRLPIPLSDGDKSKIGEAVRAYFASIIMARESWASLTSEIDLSWFGTRP